MNFKRNGPKQSRAGCLLCKPHKALGNSKKASSVNDLRNHEAFTKSLEDFMDEHNDVLCELANR